MAAKSNFKEIIKQGAILADGAMGTLLHARGALLEGCFDELNISRPGLVFDIHREYIESGAQVIESNTFGANRFKLGEYGLEQVVSDINRRGIELARQAVDAAFKPDLFVAGSIGPLGVQLAPYGRVSLASAYDAFYQQIKALVDAGADMLIIETISDLSEVKEAVRAARAVDASIPIVTQMTFTRDDRTLLGDSPAQVAEVLSSLDVDMIGANCSNGPAQITRIVKEMKAAAPDKAYSAIPNAGWPEYIGGRVMYPAMPDYFADYAVLLRDLGVSMIGGCCGTTPNHIRAMRDALDDPTYATSLNDGIYVISEEEFVEQVEAPSPLAQKLSEEKTIIAVEMSPPKGIATEKALRAAHALCDAGADVIDVLDNPMARMRMSPWAVCHLLKAEAGIETVLHFPTRGRNLLRIQGDLLAAHAIGVRNLFVVMGDPTRIGDYPDAADNYDIVPSGLVRLIKQSLNKGIDSAGNPIGQPTNFVVSAALNLNATDPDREIRVLWKKIEGGVDYLLTQPIYDPALLDRFLELYEDQHDALSIPVLMGVMPLYSVRHATFLNNEVPGITIPQAIIDRLDAAGNDAPHEGIRIAQDIALQMADNVSGFYIMPQFQRYDLAAGLIETLRDNG